MSLRDEFQKLHKEYMPAPFWFWNDDLSIDELLRQIREMDEHNIGGFFMHARMGRITEYLGEEWMACCRACAAEAQQRGMGAWIYDEDNWPSGYGGGRVSDMGAEYRQRNLACTKVKVSVPFETIELPVPSGGEVLRVYAGTLGKHGPKNLRDITPRVRDNRLPTVGLEGRTLFVIHTRVHNYFRWFSPEVFTYGYIDVMSAVATRAFIDAVYEPYKEAIGRYFGKGVLGSFTDEPSMHEHKWGQPDDVVAWTRHFPQIFAERRGYDIMPYLISLFYNAGDYYKVRRDFWETCTELFTENFSKVLYDWCEENGIAFTGHYILEESLRMQTKCIGSAMMHYRYQHIPGTDHLGRPLDLPVYWSSGNVLCKQASSVANQLERERVLCETFAGGGWDFNLGDQRWMADWMYALGVNLICPHAFHYSLRSFRKRDYPPSLAMQQPWWEYSGSWGAHSARLGFMLTRGEAVRRVLVVHPLESVWATQRPSDFPWEGDWLTEGFEALTEYLLERQIDFDYGDEKLMEEFGSVEGPRLRVGRAEYEGVVIPPCITLRRSTAAMLQAMIAAGGSVFVLGDGPSRLDAVEDSAVGQMLSGARRLGDDWRDALDGALRESVHFDVGLETMEGNVRHVRMMHRRVDGHDVLFLANSESVEIRARVHLRLAGGGGGGLELWEPSTAHVSPLPHDREGEWAVFELHFGPRSSHLIVAGLGCEVAEVQPTAEEVLAVDGSWLVERLDPNMLVLDYCRFSKTRSAAGSKLQPVVAVGKRVDRMLAEDAETVDATLSFPFETETNISGAQLLIENPGRFEISLDRRRLSVPGKPRWRFDPAMKLVPLPDMEPGAHTITLRGPIAGETGLEPPVLIGEFTVTRMAAGNSAVAADDGAMQMGSWIEQGMPFYAGGVSYKAELPSTQGQSGVTLRIGGTKDAVRVFVNDRPAGDVAWAPYVLDITDFLTEGTNTLELRVASSLRNMLGPHHVAHVESIPCLSPTDHLDFEHWTEEYVVVPFGIGGPVELIVRKERE